MKNQVAWCKEQISQLITYTIMQITRWYTYKKIKKEKKKIILEVGD